MVRALRQETLKLDWKILMVRSVKPFIEGFPGLPKWLDGPYIAYMALEWGCTERAARVRLRKENDDDV